MKGKYKIVQYIKQARCTTGVIAFADSFEEALQIARVHKFAYPLAGRKIVF